MPARPVAELATDLADARQATLRLFDALQRVLPPSMEVRYAAEIDPPLWLLGHLAWREELWIARNPRRLSDGSGAPGAARAASCLPRADALYDPARVAPTQRWTADLPDPARTRRYLALVRERTLALLQDLPVVHEVLAFEDGQHERLAHLAQWLALPVQEALRQAGPVAVGAAGDGAVDRVPVTWARFMPFVEAGGYADDALWSDAGRAWRDRQGLQRPRHLAQDEDGRWQRAAFGAWRTIDPDEPALHLSRHEAEAWCRWAGRRLPTLDEWRAAAGDPAFGWGEVWEWTADAGLAGASFATAPRLKRAPGVQDVAPDRHDLFAGFRSCAG